MPGPIITGEYILGFYQDAAAFLPESFRWEWLDNVAGILALKGRLRDEPQTERVQAIYFRKDKGWNQAKIRDWLRLHSDYMAPVQSPTDKIIERLENLNGVMDALTVRVEKLERARRRR